MIKSQGINFFLLNFTSLKDSEGPLCSSFAVISLFGSQMSSHIPAVKGVCCETAVASYDYHLKSNKR